MQPDDTWEAAPSYTPEKTDKPEILAIRNANGAAFRHHPNATKQIWNDYLDFGFNTHDDPMEFHYFYEELSEEDHACFIHSFYIHALSDGKHIQPNHTNTRPMLQREVPEALHSIPEAVTPRMMKLMAESIQKYSKTENGTHKRPITTATTDTEKEATLLVASQNKNTTLLIDLTSDDLEFQLNLHHKHPPTLNNTNYPPITTEHQNQVPPAKLEKTETTTNKDTSQNEADKQSKTRHNPEAMEVIPETTTTKDPHQPDIEMPAANETTTPESKPENQNKTTQFNTAAEVRSIPPFAQDDLQIAENIQTNFRQRKIRNTNSDGRNRGRGRGRRG